MEGRRVPALAALLGLASMPPGLPPRPPVGKWRTSHSKGSRRRKAQRKQQKLSRRRNRT